MKIDFESYAVLFNAITDAVNKIDEASAMLKEAQMRAEQLFMECGDTDSREI